MSNISKHFKAKAKQGMRNCFAGGMVQDQMVAGTPDSTPYKPSEAAQAMLASADARIAAQNATPANPLTSTQPIANANTLMRNQIGEPQQTGGTYQFGLQSPDGRGAQHQFANKTMAEKDIERGLNPNRAYKAGSALDPYASGTTLPRPYAAPAPAPAPAPAVPARRPAQTFGQLGEVPGFADGVVQETAAELSARIAAKYGVSGNAPVAAPQPAPVPQPVQQAPKPQSGGLLGQAMRGLRGAGDQLRQVANYKDGLVHEGPGIVHGPGGPKEDKVDAKLSAGEAVLPAATVAALGGAEEVAELIERTNGKKPTIGLREGAHANKGGFVDDFGTFTPPNRFQPAAQNTVLQQQALNASGAGQVAPPNSGPSLPPGTEGNGFKPANEPGKAWSPQAQAHMNQQSANVGPQPRAAAPAGGGDFWTKTRSMPSVKPTLAAAKNFVMNNPKTGGAIGAVAMDAATGNLGADTVTHAVEGAGTSAAIAAATPAGAGLAATALPIAAGVGAGIAGHKAGEYIQEKYIDDQKAGQSFNDFKVEKVHDMLKGNAVGDWILDKTGVGKDVATMRANPQEELAKPIAGKTGAATNPDPNFNSKDIRTEEQRAWDDKQNTTDLKGLRAAQQFLGPNAVIPQDFQTVRQNETNAPMGVWNSKNDAAAGTMMKSKGAPMGSWQKPEDGTGIVSIKQPDGSFKNVALGKSEYTAADGTPTSDWSKTAQFAQGQADAQKAKDTLRGMERNRLTRDMAADITDPRVIRAAREGLAQMDKEDAAAATAKTNKEELGLRSRQLDLMQRGQDMSDKRYQQELAARLALAQGTAKEKGIQNMTSMMEKSGYKDQDQTDFMDFVMQNHADNLSALPHEQQLKMLPRLKADYQDMKVRNANSTNGTSWKNGKRVKTDKLDYEADAAIDPTGLIDNKVWFGSGTDGKGLGKANIFLRKNLPDVMFGSDNVDVMDNGQRIMSKDNRGARGPHGSIDMREINRLSLRDAVK